MNWKHCIILIASVFCLTACAGQQLAVPDTVQEPPERAWRILISNDDGVESEGIRQLARAVSEFAEVVVVAPEKDESGASQSVRLLHSRMQATPVDMGESFSAWKVNGTPADCVAFGLRAFGGEVPFDLVLSGINYGANFGLAQLYSGTVGAALQALVDGVPAIAISQDHRLEEWTTSIAFSIEVIRSVLSEPLPVGELLSINVPAGEIKGVKALPGFGETFIVEIEAAEDEAGSYFKPRVTSNKNPAAGSDLQAFQQGFITVTPLKLDRNAYESLQLLGKRSFISSWPAGE